MLKMFITALTGTPLLTLIAINALIPALPISEVPVAILVMASDDPRPGSMTISSPAASQKPSWMQT